MPYRTTPTKAFRSDQRQAATTPMRDGAVALNVAPKRRVSPLGRTIETPKLASRG